MYFYDKVLAALILDLYQRAASSDKLLFICLTCIWKSCYDMYFLFSNSKEEKRSSQSVYPYSCRAWQKWSLSCPMYRAFTESSLHPVNEDECLLGKKRACCDQLPKNNQSEARNLNIRVLNGCFGVSWGRLRILGCLHWVITFWTRP